MERMDLEKEIVEHDCRDENEVASVVYQILLEAKKSNKRIFSIMMDPDKIEVESWR